MLAEMLQFSYKQISPRLVEPNLYFAVFEM
jgi:hypothetical protein